MKSRFILTKLEIEALSVETYCCASNWWRVGLHIAVRPNLICMGKGSIFEMRIDVTLSSQSGYEFFILHD